MPFDNRENNCRYEQREHCRGPVPRQPVKRGLFFARVRGRETTKCVESINCVIFRCDAGLSNGVVAGCSPTR